MEVNALSPFSEISTAPERSATTNLEDKTVINSDFETFLMMLTAQLKNQDPLNPMASSEFAVQLATFSSVEQQVLTNELLGSLINGEVLSGLSSMVGFIGKEALIGGTPFFEGKPLTISAKPSKDAASARLVISNSEGFEIESLIVPTSEQLLIWEGRDANGNVRPSGFYDFRILSFDGEGVEIESSTPTFFGRISEVRMINGSPFLILAGGEVVNPNDVESIR